MSQEYLVLNNGQCSANVEFPTKAVSGVEPPDAEFLRIHAAFARVPHLSGAAEFMRHLQELDEPGISPSMHSADDYAAAPSSKLAVLVRCRFIPFNRNALTCGCIILISEMSHDDLRGSIQTTIEDGWQEKLKQVAFNLFDWVPW